MNLRDLRYLVALADYKHFGHAAAASFVSQPTLSTQIKKIESELGIALIERVPRKLILTEAGQRIVEHARSVLREIDEIKSIAKHTQNPLAGSIRLGFFPTLGPYLLPHIITKLHQAMPKLEWLLAEEKTPTLLGMLAHGKLDAACLALPIHDDQLHAEFLFEEFFVLAVPREHAYAKQTSIRIANLQNEHLLLLEDGHCLRDQALDVCHLAGAHEREGFRATSLETLRHMVAAGVGMTLLPTLAIKPPIPRSKRISLLRFRDAKPSRRIALVWRKTSPFETLLKAIAKHMQSLPKELFAP
jgi:LysR family hydrogen peroxide-inducible transcriptional activator